MITGQQIVDEAKTWVGSPFRHQGRSRSGVDCVGLAIMVRDAVEPWPEGVNTFRAYRRNPLDSLEVHLRKFCEKIPAAEIGCLALIRWPKQKHACHVGILTPGNIIHAYAKYSAVAETRYGEPWARWTVSFWRMPGVTP